MARLSFTAIAAFLGLASTAYAATACNGHTQLCSRRYSNVTYVGAHDSAFVGNLPTQNQHLDVTAQLNLGIRFLEIQSHNFLNAIMLCHTSCWELDQGTLSTYLSPIKTWLDANPNEVITLLITNPDTIAVSKYASVFSSVGLTKYVYTPSGTPSLNQWPTLQSMINAGTRLVVFMDYHADTSSVPYILDEFTYFWETPYDTTDPNFAECTVDRPSGASTTGRMSIMNHFLDIDLLGILIPDEDAAATTNSVSSIVAQADLCLSQHGSVPNVLLLDYVDQGSPIDAGNALNNV